MHVMLDLETMSSESDAAIVQIGAVGFDLGAIGRTFKVNIDPEDAKLYGSVSHATMDWWDKQLEETRTSVFTGGKDLQLGLSNFTYWVKDFFNDDIQFWAHATFDFPILDHAYKQLGLQNPVKYRKARDLRTLESFFGKLITWEKREGVHHDALDDAIFQAKHPQSMLRVWDTALQRHIDD